MTNDFYKSSNPDFKRSTSLSGNGAKSNRSMISCSKEQLLAKVLLEFYEVDRKLSEIVVDVVEQYAEVQSRPHPTNESWEDYLQYRWVDSALRYAIEFLGCLS